jgi:hypothetical protein
MRGKADGGLMRIMSAFDPEQTSSGFSSNLVSLR